MAEAFEGRDLSGAVFWGVDLTGARFRDVNLTDVTVTHAMLVDVDIDAFVDRVVVNGVDVTGYVNERDLWYPLRAMLRPADPERARATWQALGEAWAPALEQAQRLTEAQRQQSVGGEWSFVETLRHLVFAMDKWFTAPILGEAAFHPLGLPHRGSADVGGLDLDGAAAPASDEVLEVRAQRSSRLREYLAGVTTSDLAREVEVLEHGPVPLNECLYTVFEEEFHHLRYALRDLAQLA